MIDGLFIGLVFLSFIFFLVSDNFSNKRKENNEGSNIYYSVLRKMFLELFFLSLPIIFTVFTIVLNDEGTYTGTLSFIKDLNLYVWYVYACYLLFDVLVNILSWLGYLGSDGKKKGGMV